MDPATIALLVNTLGPVIIPLLSNAFTWLFNKAVSAMSPQTQAVVSPFLPVVAGAVGTALGTFSGMGPLGGMVAGLAGTGLHQVVHQPLKAATAPASPAPKT